MAVPKAIRDVEGSWAGRSKLNLPQDPSVETVFESDSTVTIAVDPTNTFATLTCTWAHEGESHEGSMLICGSGKGDTVSVAWADSWHQSASLMSLSGTGMKSDTLRVAGSYPAGEGPDWGWRIEIGRSAADLELRMVNLTPDGDEMWAVLAHYRRA